MDKSVDNLVDNFSPIFHVFVGNLLVSIRNLKGIFTGKNKKVPYMGSISIWTQDNGAL